MPSGTLLFDQDLVFGVRLVAHNMLVCRPMRAPRTGLGWIAQALNSTKLPLLGSHPTARPSLKTTRYPRYGGLLLFTPRSRHSFQASESEMLFITQTESHERRKASTEIYGLANILPFWQCVSL